MSIMRPLLFICLSAAAALAQSGEIGIFTNSGDVGGPAIKGSAEFSQGDTKSPAPERTSGRSRISFSSSGGR